MAVQGAGNVGAPLIGHLLDAGAARVLFSDMSAERVSAVLHRFAAAGGSGRVRGTVCAPGDNSILLEHADVVAPCAWGGVLNADTIPQVQARLVCGAANNQLLEEQDAQRLKDRGIM